MSMFMSVLFRDCFSQSDLHIAPITTPTESDAHAIRTVIRCLLFSNLTLPSFDASGVRLAALRIDTMALLRLGIA
jgi:hypothetical protein